MTVAGLLPLFTAVKDELFSYSFAAACYCWSFAVALRDLLGCLVARLAVVEEETELST